MYLQDYIQNYIQNIVLIMLGHVAKMTLNVRGDH